MLFRNIEHIKNPKFKEWIHKNEHEQEEIAEKNDWKWYFDWFEAGDNIRYEYEQADKDPRVKDKYHQCYDGYYKKHTQKASYTYLGMDARFHRSETPTHTWTEYEPCENKQCSYYKNGEHGNCDYFGDNCRIGYDCFNELFAQIQQWIDVCGIEAIDELQKDLNIHPDIIGWFKEGDEYFKKGDDKMYLNEKAVEEIWNLLCEVKAIVSLVSNMGINYHSDPWCAVYPINHDYANILTWDKEHFKYIDITNIDKFIVGGSMSHTEYDYKGNFVSDPEELAKAKANTIQHYLNKIVTNFKSEYFKIIVYYEEPYRDCGWECPMGIEAILIKEKCCEQANNLDQLVEQIADEDLKTAEDPWIDYDIKNPDDNKKYYAMVGFHSCELINPEEKEYRADFGPNRKYIQDASRLIRKIENEAEELRIKYADKGVKVSIGDFNDGCQYGMSIYVWVPYHTQRKEIPDNLHYY